MGKRRLTIEDVARRSGYSRATISRVINNDRSVKPATVTRVRSAIEELGYVPNRMASGLSGGRTGTVGVLVPDITTAYYSNLLEGIDEVAQERGYHLILKTRRSSSGLVALAEANMVDGLIIRHSRDPEQDLPLLRRLKRSELPLIVIGKPLDEDGASAITVDNVGGARQMAHHFLDHGFKTILFVSGAHDNLDSRDRAYGFRVGLAEGEFDLANLFSVEGDFSRESGYEAAKRFFACRNAEAVFAANDRMALGVLLYCHEHGLRVPEDLAVAGFDDAYFSEFLWPPLTTVRQPMHEIGTVAMENMVLAIEGAKVGTSQVILPTRLIPRKSCGCSFDHLEARRQEDIPLQQKE